ncbi:hypothetical protein ABW20_dc0109781 [Dactylellina cionopaga]|nr:hypothetical protein ABW20_dc0109781 [Dactylellina cionopaga]
MEPALEDGIAESTTGPELAERAEVVAKATATWWVPTQDTTWQIQLSGTLNTNIKVQAIEIDATDATAATVKSLKAQGMKVIGYLSAGSFENWRADAAKFPASVKGKNLDGWPGEKWLDVRRIDILQPIMEARVQAAKNKGFDGVDWDNVDGYTQVSGFKITYKQQLAYNRMLATISHNMGMTVALKNDLNQINDLVNYFDYAVNEQCGYYGECNLLEPFLKAGKAVVGLEYPGSDGDDRTVDEAIADADPRTYTLIKNIALDDYGIVARSGNSITR